jgi:glutamine---fructose-6-phosphate transaminase (isomerizing)
VCGIVGYVGKRNAISVLINGLEKLEYRGYDSAGIATLEGSSFQVFRSEGKLVNLKSLLTSKDKDLNSTENKGDDIKVGIGHTRWATHGRPSETNAHPHVAGSVCVVHNGIIENYLDLRTKLQNEGYSFVSETDTEIAAQLINSYLVKNNAGLLDAVKAATSELEGSYALVVISTQDPDCIVIARNSTPIIVGLGKGENFVASDIPALLEYTRQILIIEDGELVEVRANSIEIERDGKTVSRKPTTITWDAITAEKGGYRHFMLKEIYEQPLVVAETFRGRIKQQEGGIFLNDVGLSDNEIKKINRIDITACGTAWHAGLVAKFYIEKLARIHVGVDYASEYRYRSPIIDESTLFLAISQSGETADTLKALSLAKEQGARTLAICNVVGSSIARLSENVLYTHAGPEISVASTKAFVTQLTVAYMLAVRLAIGRGTISKQEARERLDDLIHLPTSLSNALSLDKQIEKVAKKYGRSHNFLYLGRGFLYPIALEGALKLKEISYLHAEGYPAGEMKHGPIALIDEETPVVVVIGHDENNYSKAMSSLKEVESRGGRIIAVTDIETEELKDVAWEILSVGETASMMLPIALTVPLQLLAYHVAVYRGTDVDQPRNLAKSVTVE